MTQYLKISITSNPDLHDLLIAELSLINYDSFQEFDEGIEAFIEVDCYEKSKLLEVLNKYGLADQFHTEKLQNINWNEQWEKNFDPVYIENRVQIRATFHEKKAGFIHDIILNPKMSFGTGHHETTHLIIAEQLSINHEKRKVLDVGTGTGVLAIMADKLGAKWIDATDIDDWCINNSHENFELNELQNFKILQGTIDKLTLDGSYDIIIANINKIVLLNELPIYSDLLANDGILVLSGFYSDDIDDLKAKTVQNNLIFQHSKTRNNWAMMRFVRLNT